MGFIGKTDPNIPTRASIAIGSSSYTTDEEQQFSFTLERSKRTDQVLDVDYQFTNVTVTPTSDTVRFENGVAILTVSVSADTIAANETGTLAITSAYVAGVSGPDVAPVVGTPNTVNIFINNTESVSDTADYDDPVSAVTLAGGRAIVSVATDAELSAALAGASPGDTILLAPNTYTGNHALALSTSADNPVIIQGADNFSATWNGELEMTGSYAMATGIYFAGDNARVRLRGNNNKLLANKFTGRKGIVITVGNGNDPLPGQYGEIAYNDFFTPGDWNDSYPPTEFRQAVKMFTAGDAQGTATVHFDLWVHHNHCYDWPAKPDPGTVFSLGDSDMLEAGETNYDWTQSLQTRWYVEDNLFRDSKQKGGGAAVDFKVGGVVFRRNTITSCSAPTVQLRQGSGSIIESNWFDTGGIVVHGANNIVIKNRMTDDWFGMRIIAGDNSAGDTVNNGHNAASGTLISGNSSVNVRIGHQDNGTFPAEKTRIEDHTGTLTFVTEVSTSGSAGAPSTRVAADPVRLTTAEVGVAAIDNAPSNWRAARIPGG